MLKGNLINNIVNKKLLWLIILFIKTNLNMFLIFILMIAKSDYSINS